MHYINTVAWKMTRQFQKIVIFIDKSSLPDETSYKIGNLYMNRFGIDEEAAFEILGVYHLKDLPYKMLTEETAKEKGRRIESVLRIIGFYNFEFMISSIAETVFMIFFSKNFVSENFF